MEALPPADLVSSRECDFAEALAALHELVGLPVIVQVLGAGSASRASALTLSGIVEPGYELGQSELSPVVFDVAGAMLAASQDSLAEGWREDMRGETSEFAGGWWGWRSGTAHILNSRRRSS
jgi:hypothetical protein